MIVPTVVISKVPWIDARRAAEVATDGGHVGLRAQDAVALVVDTEAVDAAVCQVHPAMHHESAAAVGITRIELRAIPTVIECQPSIAACPQGRVEQQITMGGQGQGVGLPAEVGIDMNIARFSAGT